MTTQEVNQKLAHLGYKDVKSFQKEHGLVVDGIVGPKTVYALTNALVPTPKPQVIDTSLDSVSLQRINLLHPRLRVEALQILMEAQSKLTGRAKLRVAQGLRTIAEQNELYAQGRTKPGGIVTNARGGNSLHNYGFAIDFVLIIDGKVASWDIKSDWDADKVADWMEVVAIFQKYGWEWGGNWKSLKDYPHFQKTFGLTLSDIKIKYNKKDFIKGSNIYINI